MNWLKIGLAVLQAYNATVALLRSWRDREAGRKEVTLAVKENGDEAVTKADAADASVSERIAAGGLRDDDGYRRD